jgi:hypothetical protein
MKLTEHDPNSPEWPRLLSRVPHDVYHLPAYVALASRHHDLGRPALFVAEEDDGCFLIPLIVRELPPDLRGSGSAQYDAVAPRGYPGPLLLPPASDRSSAFLQRAIAALSEDLASRGIVTVFSRLHPLFPLPEAVMERFGALVDHGDSWYVDLSLTTEEMHTQTEHGHRQAISKAARRGYVARIDAEWERFDAFVEAFRQSMERVGAVPFWRLTREYFEDLRNSLQGNVHLCVVESADQLAAASLITETNGIVEYHLAGTADAHLSASPSKLLIDFVRRWAKSRGNRVLHLAGSLSRGDSLSQFKAGFTPLHHPVQSWRLITDRSAYQQLVDRWSAASADVADPITGYFPAYRRPRDHAARHP